MDKPPWNIQEDMDMDQEDHECKENTMREVVTMIPFTKVSSRRKIEMARLYLPFQGRLRR